MIIAKKLCYGMIAPCFLSPIAANCIRLSTVRRRSLSLVCKAVAEGYAEPGHGNYQGTAIISMKTQSSGGTLCFHFNNINPYNFTTFCVAITLLLLFTTFTEYICEAHPLVSICNSLTPIPVNLDCL